MGGAASEALPSGRVCASSFSSRLPIIAPAVLAVELGAAAPHMVQSDTWLGLVAGREVWRRGIPATEHLTTLAAGRDWIDQQWLAQLAMYLLERIGGVGVVVAVCSVAVVTGFICCAAAAQRRGTSPRILFIFFLLAFLAGPWGAQARTQTFALPLFGLTVWLLTRDPDGTERATLWVLPILCLWANVHGSVLLGVVIVAGYGILLLARRRRIGAVYLASAPLCIFASPYGFSLAGYYVRMTLYPPFGRDLSEWRETTPSLFTLGFFLLAAVAIALVVRSRSAVTRFDLFLLTVTFLIGLDALRLTFWFGLAALAVLPPLASRGREALPGATARSVAVGVALALVAALALVPARAAPASAWEPGRLAAFVRDQPRPPRVFADLDLADWLLWQEPRLEGHVPFDARPELLTRRQFLDVVYRAATYRPGWRRVLAPYRFVLLKPGRASVLLGAGGWRRVAATPRWVLLARG
jgi:hypothetical protein